MAACGRGPAPALLPINPPRPQAPGQPESLGGIWG